MAAYLFKTEPSEFAYGDLPAKGEAVWDGVSNPAALASIRSCKIGDTVYIYHTGDEKAIVGVAVVVSEPREDPKKPGLNDRGEPKFAVVGLRATRKLKSPVTLAAIKSDPAFKDFALVKIGRLSVMPVPTAIEKRLLKMAGE